MNLANIPFRSIDWSEVPRTEYKGETGMAYWQTLQFGGIRIRIVEYTKGYIADHWCKKGHIVHCLEGDFISEEENGRRFELSEGMSYIVSDEMSSHRSTTRNGVRLLIIDGDFLIPHDECE
jgi:mannose-6-phosphate isomerase class I